jgi:hypothetical protein
MAWIEVHQALRDHPKLGRLARRLSISKPQAVGHLVFLWFWSTDYASDGDLSPFDAQEIAEAAGWDGDADIFVSGLIYAGFVDQNNAGGPGQIHDWQEYGGKLADRRKANAERQRKHREQAQNAPVTPPPAPKHPTPDVTESLRNADVTRTSPSRNGATVQNSTVPNQFANAHTTRARESDQIPDLDSEFEKFIALYPPEGHGSIEKARQAYKAVRANGMGADAIVSGLARWIECDRWKRGYVLSAADWLTGGNYGRPVPREPVERKKKDNKPEPFTPFQYTGRNDT